MSGRKHEGDLSEDGNGEVKLQESIERLREDEGVAQSGEDAMEKGKMSSRYEMETTDIELGKLREIGSALRHLRIPMTGE